MHICEGIACQLRRVRTRRVQLNARKLQPARGSCGECASMPPSLGGAPDDKTMRCFTVAERFTEMARFVGSKTRFSGEALQVPGNRTAVPTEMGDNHSTTKEFEGERLSARSQSHPWVGPRRFRCRTPPLHTRPAILVARSSYGKAGAPCSPCARAATLPPPGTFCTLLTHRAPACRLSSLTVRSRVFSQMARHPMAQTLARTPPPLTLAQDPLLAQPLPCFASQRLSV